MLLHAPFGSVWESLFNYMISQPIYQESQCSFVYTFAISPQLFPASLIVLRRCSSAGVQGVFVRLFLGAVVGDNVSIIGSFKSPSPPGSPSPVEVIEAMPVMFDMCVVFRFLEFGVLSNG